jgi:hypothetical protein
LTGRRSDWKKRSERAECFLSGLASLRCLNLFLSLAARLKSCPSQNRTLRQSRLPPFFAKNAKKGWGTRLVGTMCKTGIYGTRLMGSVRRNTRSRGLSNDAKRGEARFVLCVRNEGYPAGLELRKVYRVLADEQASKRHQLRVIDESGEDYLYPEEYFVSA